MDKSHSPICDVVSQPHLLHAELVYGFVSLFIIVISLWEELILFELGSMVCLLSTEYELLIDVITGIYYLMFTTFPSTFHAMKIAPRTHTYTH